MRSARSISPAPARRTWHCASYAGFPQEKLHVQKDYGKLMEEATAHKLPVFVMPTYTAMLALRGTISKTYGYKQFWE